MKVSGNNKNSQIGISFLTNGSIYKKYYTWSGENLDQSVALSELVERNDQSVREEYLNIRKSIVEKLLSLIKNNKHQVVNNALLLWMSLLVESSFYKSQSVSNAMKLIAFKKEISDKDILKIEYFGSNCSVARSLGLIAHSRCSEFAWLRCRKEICNIEKWLQKIINLVIGSVFPFIFYLKNFSVRLLYTKCKNFYQKKSIFIFSYFIYLDKKKSENSIFYSYQWGELIGDLVNNQYRINFVHFFLKSTVSNSIGGALKLLSKFHKKSTNIRHCLLQQHIKFYTLFNVSFKIFLNFYFWERITKPCIELDKVDGWIWPIFENDWIASNYGKEAAKNLVFIAMIEEIIKSLPHQKVGLYLQENQGWERALIYFWRKYKHGTLIGVPHSTIRYWDMRYFDKNLHKTYINDIFFPHPDKIAINGIFGRDILLNSGFNKDDFYLVEACRYQYLSRIVQKSCDTNSAAFGIVYLLGSIDSGITRSMLLVVTRAFSVFSESAFKILFKPHEASKFKNVNERVKNFQLVDALEDGLRLANIAIIAGDSSSSIDAYLSGVITIVFVPPGELNFSPLKGVSGVYFFSTVDELLLIIRSIKSKKIKHIRPTSKFFEFGAGSKAWIRMIDGFSTNAS